MIINNIGELKELIKDLPDDFTIGRYIGGKYVSVDMNVDTFEEYDEDDYWYQHEPVLNID